MVFNAEQENIEYSKLSSDEKIKQLHDVILDLTNEMEAEDQNMHPEVNHNLAIKLQEAIDALRKLENDIENRGTHDICNKIISDHTGGEHLGNAPEIKNIKDICRDAKK